MYLYILAWRPPDETTRIYTFTRLDGPATNYSLIEWAADCYAQAIVLLDIGNPTRRSWYRDNVMAGNPTLKVVRVGATMEVKDVLV